MNIKYIKHPPYVRFGNELYFVLQAYIHSTPEEKIIQCRPITEKQQGIDVLLNRVNLSHFCTFEDKNSIWVDKWEQDYGKDFTQQQLESFIKDYILRSEIFTNYKITEDKERCLLLNIRNGDYLHLPDFNCFDRKDYLNKTIYNSLTEKFDQVHIFSDDLAVCEQEYHQILSQRFKKIEYITYGSIIDDFVALSHYKNRIIWNSTFSYWAAFISDVIYNHTGIVLCPDKFIYNIPGTDRGAPYWTYINTIPR